MCARISVGSNDGSYFIDTTHGTICGYFEPSARMRSEGYSTWVCMSVCLSVKSHLTYGASVRPENVVTYSAGNEGKNVCGDLPETTAFKSYAVKHERKSQYANYSDLPAVSFLRLTHSKAPEGRGKRQ